MSGVGVGSFNPSNQIDDWIRPEMIDLSILGTYTCYEWAKYQHTSLLLDSELGEFFRTMKSAKI